MPKPTARSLRNDRRAISPIFATMMLVAIVMIFGTVAFVVSSSLTQNATDQYTDAVQDSQQSISERLSFENVYYNSATKALTIYIINSGMAENVQVNSVLVYDNSGLVGDGYSGNELSALTSLDEGSTLTGLNVGDEGVFTVSPVTKSDGNALTTGNVYTIHLLTNSGSRFTYAFTA